MNHITDALNRAALILLSALIAAGCDTMPKIIPDTTQDNVVIEKLRHDIQTGAAPPTPAWGWILWYVPVLLLVVVWVWREFFSKKKS